MSHGTAVEAVQFPLAVRPGSPVGHSTNVITGAHQRTICFVPSATSSSAATSAASASSPFLEERYPGVVGAQLERCGQPRRLVVAENALCLLQHIRVLVAAEKVVVGERILQYAVSSAVHAADQERGFHRLA